MFSNISHDLLYLAFGSDEGPMVFDRFDTVELNKARTCDTVEGFACCVRYEMKMKFFHKWNQ